MGHGDSSRAVVKCAGVTMASHHRSSAGVSEGLLHLGVGMAVCWCQYG